MRVFLALVLLPFAGVPGTFRGTVVRGPDHHAGWIYVAGRNESLRRVEITRAVVSYDEQIPDRLRERAARAELVEGAEVRVTGEPDAQGAWHASQIEIVRLSPQKRQPVSAGVRLQPL